MRMRTQLTCPHCGKQAMSALTKAVTGPLHVRTCRACGSRVGVPWWGNLACAMPLLLLLFIALTTHQLWLVIVGVPLGIAAQLSLMVSLVPLVSRDHDGRRSM